MVLFAGAFALTTAFGAAFFAETAFLAGAFFAAGFLAASDGFCAFLVGFFVVGEILHGSMVLFTVTDQQFMTRGKEIQSLF